MIRRSMRRPRRAAGVIRRDPRRERGLLAHQQAGRQDAPAASPVAEIAEVTIDQPESIVIAVPDLDRGRLTPLDRDLIGAARVLADANRGAVLLVVPSDCIDDLGGAGADRVVRYATPAHGAYLPAVLTRALIELAQQQAARHLLFADGPGPGADLGRRIAAQLGVRPAVHVTSVDAAEIVGRIDSGRREVVRTPPPVLLVEGGSAEPVVHGRHQAMALPDLELGSEPRVIDLGAIKVDRSAVPLTEAELIISAGAGVSDWAAFHRLAAELGAAEGASRVVCDLGHLPRDRQIGASGVVVEPRAYLAFGISGAPQHLQGIAQCERVVAVNSDPHAPMMQRADLAIVADVQRVMPVLTNLIEQEKRRA
jgi:electron transfer flavoprotein alpha subunit